jgi:hypothetical protein
MAKMYSKTDALLRRLCLQRQPGERAVRTQYQRGKVWNHPTYTSKAHTKAYS